VPKNCAALPLLFDAVKKLDEINKTEKIAFPRENRAPVALHATEVLPPREGIKALASLELKARKTLVSRALKTTRKSKAVLALPMS
jgi:hypothetical protein